MRTKEKLVSQNSNFLKNLGKPRLGAFFQYNWHLYETFLFSDLRGTMGYDPTLLSLKNGLLHSKIDQFLKCGQKSKALHQWNDTFLIVKTVLMLHMRMNIVWRIYRKQKIGFENFPTGNPSPTVHWTHYLIKFLCFILNWLNEKLWLLFFLSLLWP